MALESCDLAVGSKPIYATCIKYILILPIFINICVYVRLVPCAVRELLYSDHKLAVGEGIKGWRVLSVDNTGPCWNCRGEQCTTRRDFIPLAKLFSPFSRSYRIMFLVSLTALVLSTASHREQANPLPPVYTLGANSTAWLRHLPQGPDARVFGQRMGAGSTAYSGDIRARLELSDEEAANGQPVTAQIWWRRRDPRPENKSVIITDESGNMLPSTSHLVEAACGVISFVPTEAGKVYFA